MKNELSHIEIIYLLEIICDSLEHGDNWGTGKRKVTIMLIKKVISAIEARSQKPEARSLKNNFIITTCNNKFNQNHCRIG